MTSTEQKGKAAGRLVPNPADDPIAAPAAPEAAETKVVSPPYDPEPVRPVLQPQSITVSQYPASPPAIRLECLKIALGRGLSATTPDSRQALRLAVDDYYAIVMGEADDGED